MATTTDSSATMLRQPAPVSTGDNHQRSQNGKSSVPVAKRCSGSIRDEWVEPPARCGEDLNLTILVMGASGDLAKKKTYPALFTLFAKGFFPKNVQVVGYARSKMDDEELRGRLRPNLKGDADKIDEFLKLCSYEHGEYSGGEGYTKVAKRLGDFETCSLGNCSRIWVGRLLYLALPPTVYPEVCEGLKTYLGDLPPVATPTSWIRIVLEKPFGKDLQSSEELASRIGAMWSEEHLFRIDHYLGKELVQNLLVLRFANSLFNALWNRHWVANVQITFKEPFGTEGRGGYFDSYGIIRDVIQNHLIQILALLAMESPVSLHPDDIRDEKVKLLRCVEPARVEDCVLGQYTAGNGQPGYLEDPTVPSGSKTATFAALRLYIRNDRWAGVPFIIKAGKALNERTALVRMQLKTPAASLFGDLSHMRDELVIRFQPGEAIYAKMVVKQPGLEFEPVMSELDLTYPERYADVSIPDAYERLILDCIRGDQQHFVRRDELRAAWAIFTPLLHAIDAGKAPPPLPYPAGSRGPVAADHLLREIGYTKSQRYQWQSYESRRSFDEPRSGSNSSASTPRVAGNQQQQGKL